MQRKMRPKTAAAGIHSFTANGTIGKYFYSRPTERRLNDRGSWQGKEKLKVDFLFPHGKSPQVPQKSTGGARQRPCSPRPRVRRKVSEVSEAVPEYKNVHPAYIIETSRPSPPPLQTPLPAPGPLAKLN